jgi:hypothetical protein
MSCDDFRELLAGYQDGELDEEQQRQVERHLQECEACREELARLDKVKEVAGSVQFDDLPLKVWEGYWQGVYRRVERGLGWMFTSIGVILLSAVGAFHLVRDFFFDARFSIIAKIGVAGLLLGCIFLLVSLVRERIFAYSRERYREVQR